MRILVVEDEATLCHHIAERLQTKGFLTRECGDGAEGLYLASEYPFDAAIIDLGLPRLSGLTLIRRLRAAGSLLPILILTARDHWQEKVEGLEAGADDYLTKPFHIEELEARLRALVRRAMGSAQHEIECGPLRLDLKGQHVWVEDRQLELTAFEYRLLERLVTQHGRVLSKRELVEHLYTDDEDRDSNVLEVLIGRLRRKLDPTGRLTPIETLRGRGYRFTLG